MSNVSVGEGRAITQKYQVFIDESGEAGLKRIRTADSPGASPYFVMGALVCTDASANRVRKLMDRFRADVQKKSWKHATELGHAEKVHLARQLGAQKDVRFFAVLSNKSTLREYGKYIDYNSHKFYNKCACYLLELICKVLKARGAREEDISVVFEERNHDYDAMRRYLTKVKDKPHYSHSRSLEILNVFGISAMKKGEDALLDVADFIGHAVYQLVNKSESNFFIPEPRYFQELSPRFAASNNGEIEGVGVKYIHSLKQLKLDADIEMILQTSSAEVAPMAVAKA
ncbi:DUF3800 domain-containing protein [Pararhodobacter oceanensis]|uniref:DUF3800 domain-containing protein n=1 Tax=Pararhodobacter oceanensis TaxID=2172121 RepID=UPI003A912DF3